MVFQEPRLMPWLTIDDNVAFGIHRLSAAGGAAKACPGDIGPRRARQVRRALAARICPAAWLSERPSPAPWSGGLRSCIRRSVRDGEEDHPAVAI